MEHLFVVRHGVANHGTLTQQGRNQIYILSDEIKRLLKFDSVYMVSSTLPRAVQSAEIIKNKLNLDEYERLDFLCAGDDAPVESYDWQEMQAMYSKTNAAKKRYENLSKLLAVVEDREDLADGLIIVTHFGVSGALIRSILQSKLSIDYHVLDNEPGECMYFNFNVNTFSRLPFRPYKPKPEIIAFIQKKIKQINDVYDDYEEYRKEHNLFAEPYYIPIVNIPLFLQGTQLDYIINEILLGNPIGRERYRNAEIYYLRELKQTRDRHITKSNSCKK